MFTLLLLSAIKKIKAESAAFLFRLERNPDLTVVGEFCELLLNFVPTSFRTMPEKLEND